MAPQESPLAPNTHPPVRAQHLNVAYAAHLQAYAKLSEPAVLVKVREADQGLAKEAIEAARTKFKDAFGKDGPDATLDTKTFLASAGTDKEGENSW